jgi:FkbM family methyltransferase
MFNAIEKIKNFGYVPDVIFDIGAHHGNWTIECLKIFPESTYHLFEPIDYRELDKFKNGQEKINVRNVILNDCDKDVEWFEMRNTGDSIFREKSKHFIDCIPSIKPSYALDTIIQNLDNNSKVFIKIDCQGAEIPILKGATKILGNTDFILLEIPLFGAYNENVPNFLEHIQFMDSIHFVIYDIVETHYINGFSMQIDVIFINKNHHFNKLVQERML